MKPDSVLVVLLNYGRPQNMPSVIRAWREQTVPPARLVVVDNSLGPTMAPKKWHCSEPYPRLEISEGGPDDVWRMTTNHGCPCRFGPALVIHDCRYVLFADDDLLPGKQALERALEVATGMQDRFATLGQAGRCFHLKEPPGKRYKYGNVAQDAHRPVPVHLTCRCHLIRSDMIYKLLPFRNALLARYSDEASDLVGVHDDLLLCLGIQLQGVWPSYVMPREDDPDRRMIKDELPAPDPLHQRPGHLAARNRFVDMALECGWRPPEMT